MIVLLQKRFFIRNSSHKDKGAYTDHIGIGPEFMPVLSSLHEKRPAGDIALLTQPDIVDVYRP
jgi:hypothetical protein